MTLTELSFYSRRMMPFGVIGVLLLFIFFYVFQILMTIGPGTTGPAQVALEPVFKEIPPPDFGIASPSGEFKFTLDTIDGRPVQASSAAYVNFMPPTSTRFGYIDKIYLMAKTLGFDTDVVKHKLQKETEAVFDDGKQKLTVDITNFNFTYKYDVPADDPIFTDVRVPDSTEAVNTASDFLKTIDRYPEELAKGKSNLIYLNFNPGTKELSVVQKPVDANMVEVDFYRPDIQSYPIVSPSYFNSQNYVVIVYNQKDFKIIRSQVHFYEKSDEQVGIYPIKTGDQAWKELQEGKGSVVVAPSNTKDITIKQMFLGYYDPDSYQPYLEPVYVFLGEGNFAAYVPAIDKSYISTSAEAVTPAGQ